MYGQRELQLKRVNPSQFSVTFPGLATEKDGVFYIFSVEENHKAQQMTTTTLPSLEFTCNSGCKVWARRITHTLDDAGNYRLVDMMDSQEYYLERYQPYFVRLFTGGSERIYWPLSKAVTYGN